MLGPMGGASGGALLSRATVTRSCPPGPLGRGARGPRRLGTLGSAEAAAGGSRGRGNVPTRRAPSWGSGWGGRDGFVFLRKRWASFPRAAWETRLSLVSL